MSSCAGPPLLDYTLGLNDQAKEPGTHLLRASLLLMKWKKAGSHTRPEVRQASLHDWPSADTMSLNALSGGQQGGAVELAAQPRNVELDSRVNRPPGQTLEALAGGNGGAGLQKSCTRKDRR